MAARDMKVSVLVQLVDRLTAPLRGITAGLTNIGSRIGDIGRRIGLVGGALAALSFAQPIQQAAAYDSLIRDIAITAGKTGGAVETMMGEIGKRYEKLALETGQRSMDIGKASQVLIASNMAPALIDKLMPTIARVATATGATLEDTAKTAFSLSDSLKVPADQMEAMLGKLVVAGKLGRFEFKNMATEFPALTAQMAKFGITGAEAVESLGASLQIAMLGTANPSEAANNLKNFLTKINAPEAIKKFEKELKVDVTGVMTDAAAKGINPVEAVIQKLSEKLKVPTAEIDKIMKKAGQSNMPDKDKEKAIRGQIAQLLAGTKVGRIYADMQVLDFLVPTLLNTEKLRDFKTQIKAAGIDVIAQDFASRMRGLEVQLNGFAELGSQAMRRIGLAFASNLPAVNQGLMQLLQWVAAIDAKWPGLIDGVLSWTGVLLALGAGVAILTPVFSALAGVVGLIGAVLAALLSPVGLVASAFALAAYAIWSKWAELGPKFGQLLDGLKTTFGGFGEWVAGIFTGDLQRAAEGARQMMSGLGTVFSAGWEIVKSLFQSGVSGVDSLLTSWAQSFDRVFGTDVTGAYERFKTSSSEAWAAAMTAGSDFWTWLGELPGKLSNAFTELGAKLKEAGSAAIQGLWDGMKGKWEEMLAWGRSVVESLKSTFSFAIPGPTITTPGAPAGPKSYTGSPPDPMGNPTGFTPTSAPGIGGSNGFTRTAATAANSNVQVGGQITVAAAEGSRIVNVQSSNPAVPVTPNRGSVVDRA